VSLADAIKKPIVPLLMEPMSWPPEGPMSLVFAQLLYIDFCQPTTDVQDNWSCPQFDQLTKQISDHIEKPKTVRIPFTCKLQIVHLHCDIRVDIVRGVVPP